MARGAGDAWKEGPAMAATVSAPAVVARPAARHRLAARAALLLASLLGLAAYLYPFWLPAPAPGGDAVAHAADAPLLLAALGLMIVVALAAEASAMPGGSSARLVACLGVLVAVNSALRLLPSVGGASPLFLLILLVGYVYRATYGFLMGALTLAVSALVTGGVGPWLPYQMLGAGWLGLTAGWLPELRRRPVLELALLAGFGAVWGVLYGAILNLWFWPFLPAESLGWQPGASPAEAVRRYAIFYLLTSLWYDLLRAGANAALVLALGRPLLVVLRRFQRRMTWTPVTRAEERAGDAG
jgi:energy-coupling factor transport system substrate-specific component